MAPERRSYLSKRVKERVIFREYKGKAMTARMHTERTLEDLIETHLLRPIPR